MTNFQTNSPGYSIIGLVRPKTPENVGSVLRACGCFGVTSLFVENARYPKFKKPCTDTSSVHRHIPLYHVDDLRSMIPYDCVPVAVDLIDGAKDIVGYHHRKRAFYIFGPEDGTLERNITLWCKDAIYIPTNGCLNLAASVNIVLYDRLLKALKK